MLSVSFRLLLVCCAAIATPCGGALAKTKPLTLVKGGRPQMPIVVGTIKAPVAELSHYLKVMTGADFELTPPGRGKAGIHVGLVDDFPSLKIEREGELGPEGFIMRTEGGSVFLVAVGERGVQHAVTSFLHGLGCRWFFPGEAWEIVPKRKAIVGVWNTRQVPSFPTQRRIWYGFGAYPAGKRDLADWERHNRMGGPIEISIGHTWHGLSAEKDFATHPEWFALVDGVRQASKPCYSHPAVLQRAIVGALQQAAKGQGMISMTPPDHLGYCECKRCLAVCQGAEPFDAHKSIFAHRPDGVLINVTSETLFAFVNKVAEAVAAKHPQTLIGCYAYSAYSHPPSFDLHPNVYLQTTTAFRRTPIALEEQLATFGRKTAQVGIREYYSVYQWDWDYPDPGKMTPAMVAKDLRFFHRCGVTAINAEASNNWAARGIGYYLASQLMWDVSSDPKGLLRDFYEKSFGPAALSMERYFTRWGGPDFAVLDEQNVPVQRALFAQGKFDAEALRAAYRDLDKAVALVPVDSAYRQRIDQIRIYAHYLTLRYRLHKAEEAGDQGAIVQAIKAETIFAARLANTNLIHTRPLLGKAFLRRFKKHEELLSGIEEAQQSGRGWRTIREPPTRQELKILWAEDQREFAGAK